MPALRGAVGGRVPAHPPASEEGAERAGPAGPEGLRPTRPPPPGESERRRSSGRGAEARGPGAPGLGLPPAPLLRAAGSRPQLSAASSPRAGSAVPAGACGGARAGERERGSRSPGAGRGCGATPHPPRVSRGRPCSRRRGREEGRPSGRRTRERGVGASLCKGGAVQDKVPLGAGVTFEERPQAVPAEGQGRRGCCSAAAVVPRWLRGGSA